MTDPVCDPHAGWQALNTTWSHCRDGEEACINRAHLIDLNTSGVRMLIFPSWSTGEDVVIPKGGHADFIEPDGTVWQVHCDGIVTSMKQANIRICYILSEAPPQPEPEPEPVEGYDLPLYGSTTVFGYKFTNTRLICATAQAVIRPEGLAAKTLVVGGAGAIWAVGSIILPGSIITTSVIMGGIYLKLRSIDAGCTKATVDIFEDTYTTQDHDEVVDEVTEILETAGMTVGDAAGDDFTPEEVEAAITEAEKIVSASPEEAERQRKVANGEMTVSESKSERKAQIVSEAMRILFKDNFTLTIPSIVMAGDVDVSGRSPKQNMNIQIMAVKKLLGFDYLAKDTELVRCISDMRYQYKATLTLDEFGLIEVYSRIPKEWWEILGKDIETEKHTVLVLTPMILLALLAMLAMVLDKKYNFIGMFKKKRGKK